MQNVEELEILCQKVCEVSKHIGKFILLEQKRLVTSSVEAKGTNDFVTYVDKASEQLLVNELRGLLPEAGFITEENTVSQEDKPYKWVIDPIDGTTNFIHGLPLFCISIALMHEQKVILGVIYEMSNNECFHAVEGGNAYLNEKVISVSNRAALKDSLLVTGFPYRFEGMLDQWVELFKYLIQNTHGVRRLGSAAIDLAYVACGRFEAFYEYGLSPWDVAAGVLIVKQAGGQVSDYNGGNDYIFGKELLAGNGAINNELMQHIQHYLQVK
jgi:myo-inositol-1(or 4)-monophosphatase